MTRTLTEDALGVHERASATPFDQREVRAGAYRPAPGWAQGTLSLRTQLEWFAAVVTTPESEPAPVDATSVGRLVTPSATLTALERIDIYRRSYHSRLIECLADDYPVLQQSFGPERFEQLCRAYIARYPSRAPSLNAFGRHMPQFCREDQRDDSGFAAALASLEWAIVLAIHAPSAAPLSLAELKDIPTERWPSARLIPNPSLQILEFDYPVNAYFQACRRGATPPLPAPEEGSVAVYRTGRQIWRMPLTPPMRVLVEALAQRATIATALERAARELRPIGESEAATEVKRWFQSSVSSGLFCDIEFSDD